jgi:hypothetical protein
MVFTGLEVSDLIFVSENKWGSLCCLFLKLVQINFIFTDNVRILYIYFCRPCCYCLWEVFFVVRVTLVPVSYLSAPSAVHSYRVPGKFIRRLKSLSLSCHVILFIDFAREWNMIIYCTEIAFC